MGIDDNSKLYFNNIIKFYFFLILINNFNFNSMKAKFKYEDKEITIQFNIEESAQEVFNHFVNKTFLNIDDLLFKYDNNLLSFNTTLFSQLNLPLEND